MTMPPTTPRPLVLCPACQGTLRPVGRVPLRADMAQAGIILQARPDDGQVPVVIDAYRCHGCGRLEFYDHDFLLPGT